MRSLISFTLCLGLGIFVLYCGCSEDSSSGNGTGTFTSTTSGTSTGTSTGVSGLTMRAVAPLDTDPNIDGWLDDHYIAIDGGVTTKGLLYLHFPGTGDTPAHNQLILTEAAGMGYHAVGLTYPNSLGLWEPCGNDPDPDAFWNTRMEIMDGTDRTELVDVSEYDCAFNRLVKLLEYLDQHYPSEGWGEFLSGGEPVWSKFLVGGHSQGGGHAAFIGDLFSVERVLMFASPGDYSMNHDEVAPWIPGHATPIENYVGFYHQDDVNIRFNKVWTGLGLNVLTLVNVDETASPFDFSQCLYTESDFPPCGTPHNCVIRDDDTPMDDGEPVFRPVWRYMLSGGWQD